jgi:hypothetical protein
VSSTNDKPDPPRTVLSEGAEITIVDATNNICSDLDVRNIAPATAAHIHRGAPGVAGRPVVTFGVPSHGAAEGCVSAPGALAGEMDNNPGAFYVSMHNAEFPKGVVRGQVSRWDQWRRSNRRTEARLEVPLSNGKGRPLIEADTLTSVQSTSAAGKATALCESVDRFGSRRVSGRSCEK